MEKKRRLEDKLYSAIDPIPNAEPLNDPQLKDALLVEHQQLGTLLDQSLWRQLCPWLHVQDEQFSAQMTEHSFHVTRKMSEQLLSEVRASMNGDGYCGFETVDWGFPVRCLATAVTTLLRHGYPPVWILMFDEMWWLVHKMRSYVQSAVNTSLEFNGDCYAWCLDPSRQARGWGPHRDRWNMPFDANGSPQYVTCWVALTDSTPLNGCMYVLPRAFDSEHLRSVPSSSEENEAVSSSADYTQLEPQDIRALPIQAGGVLLWSGRTLHFGGRASRRAPCPRISVSFAFSTAEFEPSSLRLSQDPNALPHLVSMKNRLRLIAAQTWLYENREPPSPPIARLLEELEQEDN